MPLDSLKEGGPKRWLQEFAGNISGPYLCNSVFPLLVFVGVQRRDDIPGSTHKDQKLHENINPKD